MGKQRTPGAVKECPPHRSQRQPQDSEARFLFRGQGSTENRLGLPGRGGSLRTLRVRSSHHASHVGIEQRNGEGRVAVLR
jgi:hypothetical protein